MSEWISVDDRLPLIDRNILLVDIAGQIETGWYFDNRTNSEANAHGVFSSGFGSDSRHIDKYEITHWMTLPPCPTANKEESLTVENADKRPQKGGWASGNYTNRCLDCNLLFLGNKRAVSCAPCAYNEKSKGNG